MKFHRVTVRRTLEYEICVEAESRHQATALAELHAVTSPDEHWVEVDYGWNDCVDIDSIPEGMEYVDINGEVVS